MIAQVINHKLHSLYTFAIVQLKFEDSAKFKAACKYMENAYGPGIEHVRSKLERGYRRNAGDNSVWYYTDAERRRYGACVPNYKIYLTTPEQLTMVSLFFN